MQQRKITLIDIGAGALPSVTPVTAQNSSWFPTVHVSAETPPIEGVTPEPVADGVLIEWDAVDQAGVVYIIERGPTQDGPWTEIHRTTETRYLYSDGSGQKWYFRITASVRGKPGQGAVVEATPAPTTAQLVTAQQKLDKEIVDRSLADANEAAARARDIGLVNAGLVLEAQTRVTQIGQAMDAVAAEGQARATGLLNERLERQAEITAVSESQQNGFDSLSRALSEVAAGSGTQFDSKAIWHFTASVEGWGSNGGAPALNDGWLRPTNNSASYAQSPAALGIDGNAYRFIKLRMRRTGNPVWLGLVRWTTEADQAWDDGKSTTIAQPAFDAAGVATVDISDIPWSGPSPIRQVRIALTRGQNINDYVEYDYIAIGRPAPGASVALVQEERQARVTALAAEANERNTLAVQMRGNYTGSDLTQAQGFVGDERAARVAADSSQVQRISTMEARMPAGAGQLATTATVTALQEAMVAADQANAQATTTVNSKLTGLRMTGDNIVPNSNFATGMEWWTRNVGPAGNSIEWGAATGDSSPGVVIGRGSTASSPWIAPNEAAWQPVKAPRRFRAIFKAKAVGTGGNVLMRQHVRDAALVEGVSDVTVAVTNTAWQRYTVDWSEIGSTRIEARFTAYVTTVGATVAFDRIEIYDVTDQAANELTAAGLQSISTRTSVIEGTLVAQGNALTQVQADIAGKASNAALTTLDSKVTQLGNTVTSQGTALTSVSAQLLGQGEVKSFQITSNSGLSGSPSGGPRGSGVRNAAGSLVGMAGRGFGVCLINGDSSVGPRNGFDTYADANASGQAMADFIAAIPENQYFIVYTSDSVGNIQGASSGAAALRAALIDAGGSPGAVSLVNGVRMYILVGRRKLGASSGAELLCPPAPSGRLDQWCEYTLQVLNGVPIGMNDKRAMSQALDATAAATSTLTGKVTALEGTTTSQGEAITSVNAGLAQANRSGSNMVLDGSFEGRAVGTAIHSWAVVALGGRTGSNALQVSFASNVRSVTLQTYDVMPDRVYYCEAWAKRIGPAAGTVQLRFATSTNGVSPTYPNFQSISLSSIPEDGWVKVSGYIRIAAGKNQAVLQLNSAAATTSATQLLWDDFLLQDVTEAYGAQSTADATANGLQATNATVTQQGGLITSLGQQVTQVGANVANKADASVVATLTARVDSSIQGGGNMLANASFKDGARGWVWEWNDSVFWIDPVVNLENPRYWPAGTNSIGIRAVNFANPPAGQTRYGYVRNQVALAAEPGKRYCASAWLNPFRCIGHVVLYFFDENGQLIRNDHSDPLPPQGAQFPTLASLPRVFVSGVAPPNARKVCAGFLAAATGPQHTNPYLWAVQPMLEQMQDGQKGPSPWSVGGSETFAGYDLFVSANGQVGGLQIKNNGNVVSFDILATVLRVLSPDGAVDGMEVRDGYIRTWKGNSQRIIGNGFGVGGEGLMDYFGPNVGAAAASKSNATVWMDVNGNAYWGGSLAAGVLRNAVQSTTTITVGTSVTTGMFSTNGRNKSVVISFSRNHNRRKSAFGSDGFVAGAGANTCTVNVYRTINGQAEQFWQQFTAGGGVRILNEVDGPDDATSTWAGSMTINDNADGSAQRSYRAEIVGFTAQDVTHQSGSFNQQTITQSLSLVSVEQ